MSTEQTPRLPAIANTGRSLATMQYSESDDSFWSSVPVTTPEQRLEVVNIMNGPSRSIADLDTKTILIVGVVACPSEWESEEDGEVKQCIMVRMILDDGSVLHSTGVTARKALSRIISAFPPPWPNGLPLKIVSGLSNNKRRVYHITVDTKFRYNSEE